MTGRPQCLQRGYALLLMLLLLMGAGGAVLAGFTQQARQEAEAQRYAHNQRVLREAKQALLMYAYNYPEFNNEGPGRLPCPDTDNDVNGLPGDGGPLTIAICTSVGRLPWGDPDLGFFDARDASGERLWYAVSDSFYNLGGGPVINSDSTGSICGNLVGARFGDSCLPPEWLGALEGRWTIETVADDLAAQFASLWDEDAPTPEESPPDLDRYPPW